MHVMLKKAKHKYSHSFVLILPFDVNLTIVLILPFNVNLTHILGNERTHIHLTNPFS